MKTTVINIKDAPADWRKNPLFVYIGRQMRFPESLPRSPFANPFKLPPDTSSPALNAIAREICFYRYAHMLLMHPELLERVKRELPGKVLVCWCCPLLCHGMILAEIANNQGRPGIVESQRELFDPPPSLDMGIQRVGGLEGIVDVRD